MVHLWLSEQEELWCLYWLADIRGSPVTCQSWCVRLSGEVAFKSTWEACETPLTYCIYSLVWFLICALLTHFPRGWMTWPGGWRTRPGNGYCWCLVAVSVSHWWMSSQAQKEGKLPQRWGFISIVNKGIVTLHTYSSLKMVVMLRFQYLSQPRIVNARNISLK